MIVNTPFVTPIAQFDAPDLIPLANSWFDDERNYFAKTGPNFRTTLLDYEFPADLHGAEPFKERVLGMAVEFATKMGYAVDRYTAVVDRVWANEMMAGSSHSPHYHYGKHLSGCYYVNAPAGCGGIRFDNPWSRAGVRPFLVDVYTRYTAEAWTYMPQPGQLFMWESHLMHSVPPGQFEGARRSVAFDICFNKKEPG